MLSNCLFYLTWISCDPLPRGVQHKPPDIKLSMAVISPYLAFSSHSRCSHESLSNNLPEALSPHQSALESSISQPNDMSSSQTSAKLRVSVTSYQTVKSYGLPEWSIKSYFRSEREWNVTNHSIVSKRSVWHSNPSARTRWQPTSQNRTIFTAVKPTKQQSHIRLLLRCWLYQCCFWTRPISMVA